MKNTVLGRQKYSGSFKELPTDTHLFLDFAPAASHACMVRRALLPPIDAVEIMVATWEIGLASDLFLSWVNYCEKSSMMLNVHNAHVASCCIELNPREKLERTEGTQGSLENVTNLSPEAQLCR